MSADSTTEQPGAPAAPEPRPAPAPAREVRYSVVVPLYNEEPALPEAVEGLRALLAAEPCELIVVDDGSTDGSAEILQTLQAADPELQVVRHERNRGYGAALKTGIRHARSELIVITDADGTYPNERIGELFALSDRFDMVVASRTGADVSYPLIRKIPKVFLKAFASWIAGQRIPDINSGLRLFRKELAARWFHMLPDGFSFTTTITLAHLTNHYRVHYLPVSYADRKGSSKIQPIRDTLRFVALILRMGIYFAPLRVFGPLILVLFGAFATSACYDAFVLRDMTDKTVLLLMFMMNTTLFALLADMIDKRSP